MREQVCTGFLFTVLLLLGPRLADSVSQERYASPTC